MRFSAERIIDSCAFGVVYFATSDQLNDPLDLKPWFATPTNEELQSFIDLGVQARARLGELTSHEIDSFDKKARHVFSSPETAGPLLNASFQRTGIFCLSESGDSPSMWAHYASNNSGARIEYDISLDNRHSPWLPNSNPHNYDDYLPVKVRYLTPDQQRKKLRIPLRNDSRETVSHWFNEAFATKSHTWAAEAEWRLIRRNADPDPSDPSRFGRIAKECITSICFGHKACPRWKALIMRHIRKHNRTIEIHSVSEWSSNGELVIDEHPI